MGFDTDVYFRVAAAVARGELYAIGGCPEGDVFLNTVEKFNPSTREWTEVSLVSNGCWLTIYSCR